MRAFRAAGPADAAALLHLVDGLADFEHLPRPDAAARARFARDLAASPPLFHALLCEEDGVLVGYAIWFSTYSTFLAQPSLYLEDIFVLPEYWGEGIGRAFMVELCARALAAGYGRLEWQVLGWNRHAIDFYLALGAQQQTEWLPYRLDRPQLERLAAGAETPESRT